jgi:hypothetical protein
MRMLAYDLEYESIIHDFNGILICTTRTPSLYYTFYSSSSYIWSIPDPHYYSLELSTQEAYYFKIICRHKSKYWLIRPKHQFEKSSKLYQLYWPFHLIQLLWLNHQPLILDRRLYLRTVVQLLLISEFPNW